MSTRKRRPQTLEYVEDYLEDLPYLLESEQKPEIEVKIEEEKEESLRIKVISTTQDGKRSESVSEAPRLFLKEVPLLPPLIVKRPPELIRCLLPLGSKISSPIGVQPLPRTWYLLQMPIKVFDREVRRILPMSLPLVTPIFYSWFGSPIKPISLPGQQTILAFTLKDLLRLIEILPRLPKVAERIESNIRIPPLILHKFFLQNEQEASLSESTEALRTKAQIERVRGKGLLELLFPEEAEKFKRLRGAAGAYAGEPILILLPEHKYHLWYLFWVICRELYREAKGSYPEPAILLDEGCDLWLKHQGALAGKIVVLRKELVEDENEERKKWFRRRLQEAFSQGLGFLIILAKEVNETVPLLEELCKPYAPLIIAIQRIPKYGQVLTTLAKTLSEGFGIPYSEIIRVNGLEARDKIAVLVEGGLKELPQLDVMVAMIDRTYREFQNELLLSNYIAYVRRDISERESEDHIAMKTLAIKYISEKFGLKPEGVTCTCEVGKEVIADLYVQEKALAVECETEFGTTPAPLLKIFESVRKYMDRPLTNPVNEVWVIVRNWSAILHLGDLIWAEGILKEELKKKDVKVKFFTPDIHGKSLKLLSDIAKSVFT